MTAITNFEDVVVKHFIDSALAINEFKGKVLDVGSGAGFPGVVLAIMNSALNITLVDSLAKRVNFLNSLIEKLDLKNVVAKHIRIEDLKEKEAFDCVTARAVAPLPILCEYLLPFVKKSGKAIIYKGADGLNELKDSQKAIKILGGQLEGVQNFKLNDSTRMIFTIRKINPTPPNYPRPNNLPRKKPIL